MAATPVLFFASWIGIVKPFEVKRLKNEAIQTAERLMSDFSVHAMNDLDAIQEISTHIEDQPQEDRAAFINWLNAYFERIHGLETFILPATSLDDGALILFNPYYPQAEGTREACSQALLEYPEQFISSLANFDCWALSR